MISAAKNSSLKVSTKPYKPRPPKTEKQNQQWNKFRALGTIRGFDGYFAFVLRKKPEPPK